MNLALTDEQQLIQQTARDYAQKELAPKAARRDIDETFPIEELKAIADLGLMGVAVPEAYGGAEAGTVAYSLAMQELAAADASVSVAVSVSNMVAELISTVGSEALKKKHVTAICDGSAVAGAFALSEPQAGSDPMGMQTRAEKIDGGYRINGTKQWITSGTHAGVIVVWAKTDPDAGHKGLTAFVVGKDAPGLSAGKPEEKMGLRGSTTVQLVFDNVEVSDDDVLGEVGGGFKLAMMALDGGRIGIASQAVGVGRAAIRVAAAYAKERESFGQAIARHQAIGNMLADAETNMAAARLLALGAAWRKQNKQPFSKHASMAKLFASEKAIKACDTAIQVHGGYGFTRDFPVERMYRDVRVTAIYEGTSEIQRIVIARSLMKEAGL